VSRLDARRTMRTSERGNRRREFTRGARRRVLATIVCVVAVSARALVAHAAGTLARARFQSCPG
jgi:hypothetical protein